MSFLYYYDQRRRRSRKRNRELEIVEASGDASRLEEARNEIIGFWAIPDPAGGYVKLKISGT